MYLIQSLAVPTLRMAVEALNETDAVLKALPKGFDIHFIYESEDGVRYSWMGTTLIVTEVRAGAASAEAIEKGAALQC